MPAAIEAPMGTWRHDLDAGGDDDVVGAGDDALGGEVGRLLRRAALAVDGGGGHRLGQAGGEHGVAADVQALVADLHDAAHDHVVDEGGVEVVALDERLEHLGGEVGGVPARELPVALAAGGADGVDDDCGGHRVSFQDRIASQLDQPVKSLPGSAKEPQPGRPSPEVVGGPPGVHLRCASMARRSAALVAGLLVLALAACGDDGGGDEDAFCDALESLSDQVADGDLASEDGLEDATDTANELLEAASSDQEDAVTAVGEELQDADPEDAADTAETVQDELGDLADDCEIDDFAEAPEEETTTTTDAEETTTTDTTADDGGDDGAIEVNGRQPVPADIAAEFAAPAQACFDGDPVACDDLFSDTPAGSVDEAYGDTCGGRITDGQGFDLECATLMVAPVPVPGDVVDTANAEACFGGDMVACDTLFGNAAEGTTDLDYGGLCAGRVLNTTALLRRHLRRRRPVRLSQQLPVDGDVLRSR